MTTTSPKQSQKETNEKHFVGIDVAKDELVVHVLPTNQQLTVPNFYNEIKQLVKLFKEINPVQIVLEAAGGLERELLINLVANGGRSSARRIRGGRADVRAALFMATFNAIHKNATFKSFFDRLIAASKKYKVALVAAMRKLITILNVMLKTKTCWKEHRVLSENF